MVSIIKRKNNGLRTYYHADRAINAIHFYRDGVVMLRTRSGWIEPEGGRDLPGLTLTQPIRRCTVVNLCKGGHFYVATGKSSFGDRQIDLYVDLALDDCAVGEPREEVLYAMDSGTTYQTVRPLTAVFGEAERRTIMIAQGGVRSVANGYGEKLAAIHAHLKANGVDARVSGIETIVKDRALLDLLLAAHQLAPAT